MWREDKGEKGGRKGKVGGKGAWRMEIKEGRGEKG